MKKLIMLPVVLLAVALVGCSSTASYDITHQIRYEVTGSLVGSTPEQASVIIYVNSDGNAVTLTNVDLPWSFTTTIESGTNVILAAWADDIVIATWIYKDGALWKIDSDSGSNANAKIDEVLP